MAERNEVLDPVPREKGQIPQATHTQTRFAGVNVQSPRQAIGDDEFLWLENAQPIGNGQLQVVGIQPFILSPISGETVVYAMTANISGTDYIFAFCSSGNAYQLKATTPYTQTKITPTPTFTSSVQAVQWKNIGILIIDPTAGYYDWNVTKANALSAISNAVVSLVVTPGSGGYTTPPTLTFTGGGATSQATATSDLQAVAGITISAAGTGYVVGDILTFSGGTTGSTGAKTQLKVTAIGAGGSITTISIFTSGDYTAVPASPISVTGGSGTGAQFTGNWGIGPVTLTSAGAGYVSNPTVTLSTTTGGAAVSATISGAFAGTSITTYAGRAWIGNGRTVAFTDVNSYNSFGGAGGSFTITDVTLHQSITQLFTANNYMYILGDDSVDVLGDVLVAGGVTSFTRTNITASVGSSLPNTVLAFYRSMLFGNKAGVYSLAGSTPQKISSNLDRLFQAIDFTQPVCACQVMVNNVLCAAFSFTFADSVNFSGTAGSRQLIAIYFNEKWWFLSFPQTIVALVSVPINGVATMFAIYNLAGNAFPAQAFAGIGNPIVIVRTKLWDGGNPVQFKQVMKAGAGLYYAGNTIVSGTWSVENELGQSSTFASTAASTLPTSSAHSSTYNWIPRTATLQDGQYFGLSLTTTFSAQGSIFSIFGVEHRNTRIWQ